MPRLSVWAVRAALLYLGLGFTFGALMLLNKGMPYDMGVWRLLTAHIDVALLGWMGQFLIGIAFWIMPRFSGERRYGNVRLAWLAVALLNAGVILGVVGSWSAAALTALGHVLDVLAVLCFALHLWSRVKPLGGQAAQSSAPES